MLQGRRAKLHALCFCGRSLACVAAKYDDVQQGVAHQTVSSVDPSYSLSCHQKVVDHLREAVSADLQSAVLIMKRRIYEDRQFSHIDIIVHIHTQHRRNTLFNRSPAADELDHRSIQPYAASKRCLHAFAPVGALADNGSRRYVTGLQRMHKRLALRIDQHSAQRTHLLRNERTEDL